MILRVSLIIAVVAALGALVVGLVLVRPHVETIVRERDDNARDRDTQTQRAEKAETSLTETKTILDETSAKLATSETERTAAIAKADEQEKLAQALQTNLTQTKSELTTTQQSLAAWNAFGVPIEDLRETLDDYKRVRDINEVIEAEKVVLLRTNTRLNEELDRFKGVGDEFVKLPPMSGKVLVVDDKWDFVVLDLGEEAGVLPNGILLVSRGEKLIGRVKITTVEKDRCIANVMADSKVEAVIEGDRVFN